MSSHKASATEPGPSWGRRLDGIEGLRGIAAVAVLLAHVASLLSWNGQTPTGRAGQLAVLGMHGLTLFFVLSGFLLFRPFASAILTGRPLPGARAFYRNRVLRIAPAYLVIFLFAALVLGSVVVRATGPGDVGEPLTDRLGRMTDPVLLFLNTTLLQGYAPSGVRTGLLVSWSLVPEVAFYVVLPALALLGALLARRLPALLAVSVPVLVLLAVGVVGHAAVVGATLGMTSVEHEVAVYGDSWTAVAGNSLLGNAHLFAFGMAVAVVVAAEHAGRIPQRLASAVRILGGATLVLVLIGLVASPQAFGMVTAGIVCSAALCWLLLPGGAAGRVAVRGLESRPLRSLGLVSYSIYLWHFPIACFALLHADALVYHSLGGYVVAVAVVLAVTLALSVITYRYVEAPALRRKRSSAVAGPAEAAGALAGLGSEEPSEEPSGRPRS